jgi:chorismate synthase
MNTFGRLLRIHIFGESHGKSGGILLDGVPAGIPLAAQDFVVDLARRRPGAKGTTLRREDDLDCSKGRLEDKTTGAPLLIEFDKKIPIFGLRQN